MFLLQNGYIRGGIGTLPLYTPRDVPIPVLYTAYLNESELCAMWMDVSATYIYDAPRDVAPQAHRAQAAFLSEGRAARECAELPPLLALGCPR